MTQSAEVELLRTAIENAKPVSAVARNLQRIFCPHILGTKNGRWCAAVWQFGGYSTMGNLPDWRYFDLADLQSMQIIDGPWHRGFRRSRPEEFAFDLVDTMADTERSGNIRVVSRGFRGFASHF
jgi:hypothetical protein